MFQLIGNNHDRRLFVIHRPTHYLLRIASHTFNPNVQGAHAGLKSLKKVLNRFSQALQMSSFFYGNCIRADLEQS